MVIYELDRGPTQGESCVTCGVAKLGSPESGVLPWAYEGYDILGRICEDCYEGGESTCGSVSRNGPGTYTRSPAARIASLTTTSSTPGRGRRP